MKKNNRICFLKKTRHANQNKNLVSSFIPFLGTTASLSPHTLDLSGLKDVLLPPKPAFFPLPGGWWMLLITLLSLALLLIFLYQYFFPSPQKYALRLLTEMEQKHLPPVMAGRALSRLLKRVALVCFQRENVASLTEKEWSSFLKTHGNKALSETEADFIALSVYMPPHKIVAFNEKKVYTAVRKWIHFVFKRKYPWKSNNRIS